MLNRSSTRAIIAAFAVALTIGSAQAADDGKYPDWKGQWSRFVTRPGSAPSPGAWPLLPWCRRAAEHANGRGQMRACPARRECRTLCVTSKADPNARHSTEYMFD